MKKKISLLLATLAVNVAANAGGLLHNTNQHIAFQRMMARGASNEIDAVFTNPAGIAFMDHDGWTLSLNIQSAYQTRNIDATVMTPAGMGLFPNDTFNKKYKGNAAAPILPSAYAAYKTPKWAISGFFGVVGGGGKCTFDDGLPLFDAAVMAGTYSRSLQPLAEGYPSLAAVLGGPITPDQYYIDGYMKGRQYIFGGQLGFSYKFNEHFSGYAGFRVNYFNGNYTGHVNATAGDILSNKFQQLAISYPAFAPELLPKTEENGLVHIAIDCSQTGWGLTPIVGINYKWRGLTLAAKYEFKTNLNIENDTKVLEAKGFEEQMKDYKHGVNTPSDMPSVLYAAVGYEFIPNKLRGTVEYHYYDDKHADMAAKKNKELKHGTHEILAGVEWDINKTFTVSAGAQRTDYGLSDKYQSNTSFSCDSYSIGLGGAINVSKNVKLNVGYFWTTYSDYKKEMPAEAGGYNGISPAITGSDVYSRTNKVFGVGVDYKF
jgi:long-chain fatty acid transport protein